MATPRYVQHIGRAEELIHRFGDEAAIPGAARGIDACRARITDRLAADTFISCGERGAREQRFRCRPLAVRQVNSGRRFPLCLEQRPHALNRRADARHDMDAVLCVADGKCQHVGQFPGAPVAQQQAPGVERAGHHRGQHAGRGDQIDVESAELFQRRGLRRRALPADHVLCPRAR